MKSRHVLAGLLALSIVALAYISVAAADYSYNLYLTSTPKGVVWQFKTEGQFSGKDIVRSSVVAQYWIGATYTTIEPRQIILTDNLVTLVFNTADLPAYADGNSVSGSLISEDTFQATGPGFAFGGHT